MSNLKNSQYTIKKTNTTSLGEDPPNSTNTSTNTNDGKPSKATGDAWLASIAAVLSGSAEVIDSVSDAANGGGQQNNNPNQPNPNNNNTPTSTVNPLWIGIGIGTVVLLIVGLLIYNNNGTNKSSGKSAT